MDQTSHHPKGINTTLDAQYMYMYSVKAYKMERRQGTQARAMTKSHWQYKCGFTSSPPEGDNQHEGAINQSEPTEVTNIINDPDDQTEATPLSETIPTQPYVTRSGRA